MSENHDRSQSSQASASQSTPHIMMDDTNLASLGPPPNYEDLCQPSKMTAERSRMLIKALFILRCILDFQLFLWGFVVFVMGGLDFIASIVSSNYNLLDMTVTFLIGVTVFVPLMERYFISKAYQGELFGFEEGHDIPDAAMSLVWAVIATVAYIGYVQWPTALLSVLFLNAQFFSAVGRFVALKYGDSEGAIRLEDDVV